MPWLGIEPGHAVVQQNAGIFGHDGGAEQFTQRRRQRNDVAVGVDDVEVGRAAVSTGSAAAARTRQRRGAAEPPWVTRGRLGRGAVQRDRRRHLGGVLVREQAIDRH